MRFFSPVSVLAVLCLVFGVCLLSPSAHADSYSIYRVGYSSGSIANIGLTDAGTLTTYSNSSLTWNTFTPGAGSVTYTTAPPFTFDNGASCSVSFAGLSLISMARCNGGYSLFSAYNQADYFPSLYLLAGGTLQQLYYGGVSNLLLNSLGDIAFKGLSLSDADTNFLYYNNTTHAPAAAVTPEPSSLLLLLSALGCCGMLFWKRTLTA